MFSRQRMYSRFALFLALTITLVPTAPAQHADSSSKNKKPEQHVSPRSAPSASAETLYRNPEFGFSYKIRYAWVDRTKEMQDDSIDPSKSRLLLAVFERPPQVAGESVNSAVVITAESAAAYPGLKAASDYIGPLTEITTAKGFKADGEPYEFSVAATNLVRADFVRNVEAVTMYQSSLLLLRKGFVVSFTFIGGSGDEIDELVERLSFLGKP
jgi:hypothetical protein